MDDLKLYTKNDDNLEGQLSTVKNFSGDIGIQFSLKKGVKSHSRKAHE